MSQSSHEMKNPSDVLKRILDDFKSYQSDPQKLLQAIPPFEMWRFFIDGARQNRGQNQRDLFNKLLVKGSPFTAEDVKLPIHKLLAKLDEAIESKTNPKLEPDLDELRFYIRKLTDHYQLEEKKDTFEQLYNTEKGWRSFERTEPNYLMAMMTAFVAMMDLTAKFDLDFILRLQKMTTTKVKNLIYEGVSDSKSGEFRTTHLGFNQLNTTAASKEGVLEILVEMKEMDSKEYKRDVHQTPIFYFKDHLGKEFLIAPPSYLQDPSKKEALLASLPFKIDNPTVLSATDKTVLSPEFLSSALYFQPIYLMNLAIGKKDHSQEIQTAIGLEMKAQLSEFDQAMKSAVTRMDQLKAIVHYVQACERKHPCLDANTRTFSMLVLNHLLMRYRFPPAILDNPNRSIGYSADQFLMEVLKGMRNTLDLAKGVHLYHVKTEEVLQLDADKIPQFYQFLEIELKRREALLAKNREAKMSPKGEKNAVGAKDSLANQEVKVASVKRLR